MDTHSKTSYKNIHGGSEVVFRKKKNDPKNCRKKASLIKKWKGTEGSGSHTSKRHPSPFPRQSAEGHQPKVGDQRAGQYPEEHPSPQLGDLPITAQVGGLINTQSLKFFQ